MKSEPDTYSIDDLKRAGCEPWDGIRNYQARNMIRDDMRVGDKVLFYHSSCKVPAVVGLARVASKPYADPTQFDPSSKYHDPKSQQDDPRWL
ncbi:MAG: EVE domain-containing protein, partial [Woeseia sp.]|nr:EVE domain-containing protein [Woeseia sp.]